MLPPSPQAGEKFRILIVEDDTHLARILMANLATAGFDCRHAPDGGFGLEVFKETKPHLVLLDLTMPVMDGREVCARIRQSSTIPIIIMTALQSEEDQMQAFKAGADDILIKPFSPQLLVANVISCLRRVYRYDTAVAGAVEAPAAPAAPTTSKLPLGWAVCEGCGYMGPGQKFEYDDGSGRRSHRCPACKQDNSITFSIS